MTTETEITVFSIDSEQVTDDPEDTYTRYDIVDQNGDMHASTYNDRDLADRIKRMLEKENSGNSIMVLRPYRWGKMWVFDDAAVGLTKEPFVSGVPEIIDDLLFQHSIDGDDGFYLTFSATPFPGFQRVLDWVEADKGGNWYECRNSDGEMTEGWLCPALFKYYDKAPQKLYAQVMPRAEGEKIKPDEAPLYKHVLSGLSSLANIVGETLGRSTGFSRDDVDLPWDIEEDEIDPDDTLSAWLDDNDCPPDDYEDDE